MQTFLTITKALSDETRVRALMMLVEGELCLCQIIEVLALAPSTVSKHMSLLHDAGLVRRRKEGRWHYYRLAGRDAPQPVRQALKWACDCLKQNDALCCDQRKLAGVRKKELEELCACYR